VIDLFDVTELETRPMARVVLRIFVVLGLFSCFTSSRVVAQDPGELVTIGQKHSIRSEVLDEERSYWVYLPRSYNDKTYTPRNYPVLFLTDGDAHFHLASGVVKSMSEGTSRQIPELILVAVPNPDRTRDLTPTHSTTPLRKHVPFLEVSGGGEKYLKFITDELIPHIDADYRTIPFRVIGGHSLGGLFTLYAFLEAPDAFDAHIAMDPILWWDDRVLERRLRDRLDGLKDRRSSVYISMARQLDLSDFEDPEVHRRGPRHDGACRQFARLLSAESPDSIRFTLQYFDGEDHWSVPLLSLYHGLLHTFEGYKPPLADFLFRSPSKLNDHFREVSGRLGVKTLPPEDYVDRMGWSLLWTDDVPDNAIELLELNVHNYPDSAHAYESLAGAFARIEESERAIENYEKSLRLNPENQTAKDRLEELQSAD
jgi:predicted alpha/beta superfamily hydrolase